MANISMRDIHLTCHLSAPPIRTEHVNVDIRPAGNGRLFMRYSVECDTGLLMLPEPDAPARSDNLWQATCFELFVKQPDSDRYFEYNFSPSTEWALYRFSEYRKGMAEEMIARPRITCDYSLSHFALNAEFDLPDSLRAKPLSIGIAAVIEETDGSKSYWALAHPPGKPDFHHRDCFELKLEAPSAT